MKKLTNRTKTHILSVTLTLAVGGLSSFLTRKNTDVYKTVAKPPFAPPSVAFPIVWTVLYVLMAVSFARAFHSKDSKKEQDKSLALYCGNLFMNFAWPIIFFNFRAFLPAFIWLVGLFGVVTAMTVNFGKKEKINAYLLIPYLLWLTFAGYLNAGIVYLN